VTSSPDLLVPLPVLLALIGASLTLVAGRRLALQRWIAGATCVGLVVAAGALLREVLRAGGIIAIQLGDWAAPFGITLVADRLSAALVLISALMLTAVLGYAVGALDRATERLFFHPVYLVMAAGVMMSFLAGDLFNLFVAFEVMLIASYVLLTLGASRPQLRTGMTYVVINLVASTLFVVAVAFAYAATGSVNMADLAVRLAEVPDHVRTGIGLLLLVVFGVKAGLFPLFFWLPDSYPTAPAPVTAIFAALLTKVGVYAIIRTQTLMFAPEGASQLLLVVAGATMLVGVLGAVAQDEVRRILSFHIVSQIGYMILGLGLFTVAGLAGAILYVLHHIVVKTALFCVGGALERTGGTGRLTTLAGSATRAPVLAALFALPALSLAGLPPFSGFVAKLALLQAGMADGHWLIVAVALLVGLLTLFSMTKIWAGAFWGSPQPAAMVEHAEEASSAPLAEGVAPAAGAVALADRELAPSADARVPLPMLLSTGALVLLSLAIAVWAQPLHELSAAAAVDLLDPEVYIRAVLR
jgi:multicomponent Na+:H+ antiporter subunit D